MEGHDRGGSVALAWPAPQPPPPAPPAPPRPAGWRGVSTARARRCGRAGVRRRVDRRPCPPRDLHRARHHDRRCVVGDHGLRARRRCGRSAPGTTRSQGSPPRCWWDSALLCSRLRRWGPGWPGARPSLLLARLRARRRCRHAPRCVVAGAQRAARFAGGGHAPLGRGRDRRRGHRSCTRGPADPAARLAGDLLGAGAGRRAGTDRRHSSTSSRARRHDAGHAGDGPCGRGRSRSRARRCGVGGCALPRRAARRGGVALRASHRCPRGQRPPRCRASRPPGRRMGRRPDSAGRGRGPHRGGARRARAPTRLEPRLPRRRARRLRRGTWIRNRRVGAAGDSGGDNGRPGRQPVDRGAPSRSGARSRRDRPHAGGEPRRRG